MAVTKPVPGQDVPVINQTGQMNQAWFEYFQGLQALVKVLATPVPTPNTSASRLIGNPTGAPAPASEVSLGFGLSFSGTSLLTGLPSNFNALAADVALNNTANYFDGPSVALGSVGTWLVFASVVLTNTVAAADSYQVKLWDGTTVIASSYFKGNVANIASVHVSLAGIITTPAGNLKVSVRDPVTANGVISANASGNSKDSHILAVRIA